ncbi:hypothetical protein BC831DRAFT_452150 [Entophlyctis helioformis]|nr:hypothetical protein BC831DRAFT_452150 [Entophlyctis helioformis]
MKLSVGPAVVLAIGALAASHSVGVVDAQRFVHRRQAATNDTGANPSPVVVVVPPTTIAAPLPVTIPAVTLPPAASPSAVVVVPPASASPLPAAPSTVAPSPSVAPNIAARPIAQTSTARPTSSLTTNGGTGSIDISPTAGGTGAQSNSSTGGLSSTSIVALAACGAAVVLAGMGVYVFRKWSQSRSWTSGALAAGLASSSGRGDGNQRSGGGAGAQTDMLRQQTGSSGAGQQEMSSSQMAYAATNGGPRSSNVFRQGRPMPVPPTSNHGSIPRGAHVPASLYGGSDAGSIDPLGAHAVPMAQASAGGHPAYYNQQQQPLEYYQQYPQPVQPMAGQYYQAPMPGAGSQYPDPSMPMSMQQQGELYAPYAVAGGPSDYAGAPPPQEYGRY